MSLLVTPQIRLYPPTGDLPPGRGFYQLEDDRLYIHVGPTGRHRHFFSYLEAVNVRLDFDRQAYLMFIEVAVPRRQWPVDEHLLPPTAADRAEVTWLDFRTAMASPGLVTDTRRSTLAIRFRQMAGMRAIALAEQVLLELDERDAAVALWVTDIEDDFAGREIAVYRRRHAESSSS